MSANHAEENAPGSRVTSAGDPSARFSPFHTGIEFVIIGNILDFLAPGPSLIPEITREAFLSDREADLPYMDAAVAEAEDLIEQGRFEDATEIGKRLERLGFVAGVDLQAQALNARGDRVKAIALLRSRVTEDRSSWSLYELLGNYLSDEGQFAEAHDAYHEAEKRDGDPYRIALNRSILLSREDRAGEALRVLEIAGMPPASYSDGEQLVWRLRDSRWSLLGRLDRNQEVIAEFEPLSAEFEESVGERGLMARIANQVAISHFLVGNRAAAQRWNSNACALDRTLDPVTWLARELRGVKASSASGEFRFLVNGVWPEEWSDDGEDYGFFSSYTVVADDIEEALSMVVDFEPEEVRDSLEIDESGIEHSPLDQPESLLKGVYLVGARHLFPLDDDGMDE